MAAITAYGVENTNAFQSSPVVNVPASKAGGRVRTIHDTYTVLGTEEAGSTIAMGGMKIPTDAQIVGWVMDFTDLGAGAQTLTLSVIGDASILLSGAVDVATGANVVTNKALGDSPFLDGLVASPSTITLTTGGGTLAAGTVKVIVNFVLD